MNNTDIVETYLSTKMFEYGDLYTKCVEARAKYTDTSQEYYYTDEDYDNFLMLASAWSAIIRRTWRVFVTNGECEPFEFWNAFVKTFTFNQRVLMLDQWNDMNKYHRKLKEKIDKTSNPKFIEKMFTGMDWNWLHRELIGNTKEKL